MKAMRHAMILQIIERLEVETQERLVEELMAEGIGVTQATISRDIKELRLIKVMTDHGTYKYSTPARVEKNMSDRMMRIFNESVVSINDAENLVIIKTLPASAAVACEAVDGLNWPEIVGTLAGENSIFVAVKDREMVPDVMARFHGMMKN